MGIKGYLLKSSSIERLIDSVRLVASGSITLFAGEGNGGLFSLVDNNKSKRNSVSLLSPREREILCRIAKGETTKEVALSCYISQTTVKAHVAKILYKLDVKNRSEAVAIAVEQGLLNHTTSPNKSIGDDIEAVELKSSAFERKG